ncbi:MAG: hypothetical protein WC436_03450 [Candidatus Babeliales bacterium]
MIYKDPQNKHQEEIQELHSKKHKKPGFYSKLKQMTIRAKAYLKSRFPVRFWNKVQENKKGPKF